MITVITAVMAVDQIDKDMFKYVRKQKAMVRN